MTTQRISRNGAMAVGALAVSVGVVMAAGLAAAPARADDVSDGFLSALTNAGVGYDDPNNAVQLGQSVCPMLSEPGGNFAKVASTMSGRDGLSADMAGLFTSIAISMYCPQMMTSFTNGDFINNGGNIPGLPFQIPGLSGWTGQ
jgi:Protein of unknown function (DUF732)